MLFNSEILTAPPAAGFEGVPAELETVIVGSQANIDMTAGFAESFAMIQFEFINLRPATAFARCDMRVRTQGGSIRTTFGDYRFDLRFMGSLGPVVIEQQDGNASDRIVVSESLEGLSNDAGNGMSGSMFMYAFEDAARQTYFHWECTQMAETDEVQTVMAAGSIETAEVNDLVRFLPSVGLWADGLVRSWGWPDA